MMKTISKFFLLLALGILPTFLFAATTTVSGNYVQDGAGNYLATGTFCFTGSSCLAITGSTFSGNVTSGTGTVTIVNASSSTILTVPNVTISGATFNWNNYVVPVNASISGVGFPYLPCALGAQYTNTVNSLTINCISNSGQTSWGGTTTFPTPSGLWTGYGAPTFTCVSPCLYQQVDASPTTEAVYSLLAGAGIISSNWVQQTGSDGAGSVLLAPSGAQVIVQPVNTNFTVQGSGTAIVDFSGMPMTKLSVAAGCTTTAAGETCHDSTNHNWHDFDNGVDNFVALFPSVLPPTSGHAAGFLKTGNVWTLEDLGAPGTVTSVSGTANQIDVAAGASMPVISIDPAYTFPGAGGYANLAACTLTVPASWCSGTTLDAWMNAANTYLIGQGGGIMDARELPPATTETIASAVTLGDRSNHAVTLLLPPVLNWLFTETDGLCGITITNYSSIIGVAPNTSRAIFRVNTSSANLSQVVCTDPYAAAGNQQIYARAEGFQIFVQQGTIGSSALEIQNLYDGSHFAHIFVSMAVAGKGIWIHDACCSTATDTIGADCNNTVGCTPITIGKPTSLGVLGIAMVNTKAVHPDSTLNNILFEGGSTTQGVTMVDTYMEDNLSVAQTAANIGFVSASEQGITLDGVVDATVGPASSQFTIAIPSGPSNIVIINVTSKTGNAISNANTTQGVVVAPGATQPFYDSGSMEVGTVYTSGSFCYFATCNDSAFNPTANGAQITTSVAGNRALLINNSAATPTADLLDIAADSTIVAKVGPNGSITSGASGAAGAFILGNATSGLLTVAAATGAITSYAIDLPVAQPSGSSTYLSCTAANPAVCTWAAGGSGFSNPMTTLGDVIYGGASGAATRLAGPTGGAGTYFLIDVPVSSTAVAETFSAAATGTGAPVLATSPTLVTPALGTPSALVITSATGTCTSCNVGGNAATVTTAASTTNSAFSILAAASTSGSQAPVTVSGFTINPSTGALALPGPVTIAGTTHGITIPAGTAVSGVAGSAVYASDSTNGYAEANENNTGLSRLCTAANGQCAAATLTGTIAITGNTTALACTSGTVSIASATTGMVAVASAAGTRDPDLFTPTAYVSAAGTVTVEVCTRITDASPASITYNVRVIQ
jgi:hypothetical protein